jgi:hypothetical protein
MQSELEALKSLLLSEWDPLGLNGCEGAERHYDTYALQIFGMLTAAADVATVAKYLNSVVTSELFLTGNIACDRAIAAKAAAIHQSAR